VEHGADVEKFRAVTHALAATDKGAEQEDPPGVVVKQVRFRIPDKLRCRLGHSAIRHSDARDCGRFVDHVYSFEALSLQPTIAHGNHFS